MNGLQAPDLAIAHWVTYLDALETAVRAMDDEVIAGRPPNHSRFADLAAPAGPLPTQLTQRRALVVALLRDVTARAESRRTAIAAELAALPGRRAASPTAATSLGGTLDVMG